MVSRSTSNQQPFISTHCVRDALNSLLYASPPQQDNALEHLTLVEEKLGTPHIPQFENARLLTVQTLLIEAITEEFTRLRMIHELPPPHPDTPRHAEIHAIQRDGATGSPQLIAWSLLYYRYVRSDLEISPDDYAQYIGFDPRTLRRYRQRSYKDLTQKLIIAEWKSRVRQRYLRLYNALPYARRVDLFGRDALFERMHYLWSTITIKHVLITGASGMGKTVFAQEFIRQLIEASQDQSLHLNPNHITNQIPPIEHLVWVTSPSSMEDILYQISESLALNQQSSLSLRDYLLRFRVIIVLDDVLNIPVTEIEAALKALSAAEVIITSLEAIPFKNPIPQLILRDLSLEAIEQLIRANAPNFSDYEIEDIAESIRLQVGGNPHAIKLAIQALLLNPHHPLSISSLDTLYERQFTRLPVKLQSAWSAFALIPENGLMQDEIQQLWRDISPRILQKLSERHLIETQANGRWMISITARKFIAFAYTNNPDVQQMIHQRLETILRLSETLSQETHAVLCLACIEHILYQQFPPLSAETQTAWLLLLLNSPLNAYRPPTHLWQAILEREYRNRSLDLPFILEYGRLLRRVQHWDKAQLVFEDAIFQAGQRGNFVMQTHGMVEMATLLRIRGAYDKALRLLEEAQRTANRYHASAILQTIYFEKAQIALDQKDPQTAAYYLEKLPESPRSLMLLAEFALLNNMPEVGIRAALSARQAYSTDRPKLSLAYILLGRLYTAAANYDLAHQYLALAVTLSEQLNDSFTLARAKAALALVFIHQHDTAAALYLLQHAEKIQQEINDHVGLAFTQHNLAWLRH